MNKLIGMVLSLVAINAHAELRTWQVSGVVANVSGPNLPVPVIVGNEYTFSVTFDDATPGIQHTDGCASYVDAVKAMAVRVGPNMVANPLNGSLIIVCDNSLSWSDIPNDRRDVISINATGRFDSVLELISAKNAGPLRSSALPILPPKSGFPLKTFGLTAFENGIAAYFTANVTKVKDPAKR